MSRFTLKQLFSIDVPVALTALIMTRINTEMLIRAKRKIMAFGIALVSSSLLCVWACVEAYNKFAASTSPKYLSLLLSDKLEVLVLWKQFAAVVAESVPLVSVTVALIALMATLYLFKKFLTSIAPAKRNPLTTAFAV